jgi:hypothetical protein
MHTDLLENGLTSYPAPEVRICEHLCRINSLRSN